MPNTVSTDGETHTVDILLYWAPPLARYERIADTSRISRILTILFGHPPLYLEAAGSREKSFCTDCRHMTILPYCPPSKIRAGSRQISRILTILVILLSRGGRCRLERKELLYWLQTHDYPVLLERIVKFQEYWRSWSSSSRGCRLEKRAFVLTADTSWLSCFFIGAGSLVKFQEYWRRLERKELLYWLYQ
jgi:hypothetical protein